MGVVIDSNGSGGPSGYVRYSVNTLGYLKIITSYLLYFVMTLVTS